MASASENWIACLRSGTRKLVRAFFRGAPSFFLPLLDRDGLLAAVRVWGRVKGRRKGGGRVCGRSFDDRAVVVAERQDGQYRAGDAMVRCVVGGRPGGKTVTLDFDGIPYVLVWNLKQAKGRSFAETPSLGLYMYKSNSMLPFSRSIDDTDSSAAACLRFFCLVICAFEASAESLYT
nr:hypothetical protein CFP56_58719 [Quercus suber]